MEAADVGRGVGGGEGGGGGGGGGGRALYKLRTAALIIRDVDGDNHRRRHSYCLVGYCHEDGLIGKTFKINII